MEKKKTRLKQGTPHPVTLETANLTSRWAEIAVVTYYSGKQPHFAGCTRHFMPKLRKYCCRRRSNTTFWFYDDEKMVCSMLFGVQKMENCYENTRKIIYIIVYSAKIVIIRQR